MERGHSSRRGEGKTVFSIFKGASDYYPRQLMINFRVSNLAGFLERLRAAWVRIDDQAGEYSYGKFAWVYGPRRQQARALGAD